MKRTIFSVLVLNVLFSMAAQGAETYGFRRDGTGLFPEANPPTVWSTDKNVIWKTPMPDRSEASPILVGDKIFVCSDIDTLICVNAADGKILWQQAANGYKNIAPPEQIKADEAKAVELIPQMKAARQESNQLTVHNIPLLQKEIQALEAQLKDKPGDAGITQNLNEKKEQAAALTKVMNEKRQLWHKVTEDSTIPGASRCWMPWWAYRRQPPSATGEMFTYVTAPELPSATIWTAIVNGFGSWKNPAITPVSGRHPYCSMTSCSCADAPTCCAECCRWQGCLEKRGADRPGIAGANAYWQ